MSGGAELGNRTLAIIKPNAMTARQQGKIIDRILKAGFEIVAARILTMDRESAERFYAVHRGRPFFEELVTFMSSGPCMPLVLEQTQAVEAFRTLLGATDPAKAEDGTLRRDFGASKGENAVHGSDSLETAESEVAFFFAPDDIL